MSKVLRGFMVVALFLAAAALAEAASTSSFGAYTARVTNGNNTAASGVWSTSTCVAQARGDSAYFFWRFDDASGSSVADASGNNRPASYTNTGFNYRSTAGPCSRDNQNNVVTLTGNGYVYTNVAFGSAPTTLSEEFWFKTTTGGGKIAGLGDQRTGGSSVSDRHVYLTDAGRLVFGVLTNNTPRTVSSPDTYLDGRWHHVVATLAPSGAQRGITLYVDGEAVAANAAYTSGSSTPTYIRVGADTISSTWPNAPSTPYYTGGLADLAFYPSALTPDQVRNHYYAGN